MNENGGDNSAEEVPKTLYHYCDVSAFYGILKSKEIWLSSAYFTNDYSEQKLLIDKAVERLQATTNDDDREYNDCLVVFLRNFTIPPYIACFSSESDLLSQWRAYCGDGKGFAIGFSVEALQRQIGVFETQRITVGLEDVFYETQKQENMLGHFFKKYQAAKPATLKNTDEWLPIVVRTWVCLGFSGMLQKPRFSRRIRKTNRLDAKVPRR